MSTLAALTGPDFDPTPAEPRCPACGSRKVDLEVSVIRVLDTELGAACGSCGVELRVAFAGGVRGVPGSRGGAP